MYGGLQLIEDCQKWLDVPSGVQEYMSSRGITIGRTKVFNLCKDNGGQLIAIKKNPKRGRVVHKDAVDKLIEILHAKWQQEYDDKHELQELDSILGWRVDDDE